MKTSPSGNNSLERYAKPALIIGLIGILVAGFGLMQGLSSGDSRPIMGWLLGFSAWYSMAIGMLMIIMIWYLFDAGWSTIIRRQLEHAVAVFPWLAIAFLPLLLIGWLSQDNSGILWSWMDPILEGAHNPISGDDPLLHHKSGFLNLEFLQ